MDGVCFELYFNSALPPQTITAGTSRTLGALLSPAMTSEFRLIIILSIMISERNRKK